MSASDFKKAYSNLDINELKKYIPNPKVLSTKEFTDYLADSYKHPKAFSIMLRILFAHYNLNKVASFIIDLDNIDLLEQVLDYDDSLKLDRSLILKTLPRGRVTMAKMIYEYIYGKDDELGTVKKLLREYNFVYNPNENSIDSFVLAIRHGTVKNNHNGAERFISYIVPNFWNDFAIKYCVDSYCLGGLKRLLANPIVDPGVDDNFCLKLALRKQYNRITNELLKHPLVSIEDVTPRFVGEIIRENFLCVAERLLRSANDKIITFFKVNVPLMVKVHNDVTYLAIKVGIFGVSRLLRKYPNDIKLIKAYLRNFLLDEPYATKPYDLNLDPEQIYQMALENDDIDLARSIIHYPISIRPILLFRHLLQYKKGDVYDYIWNVIIPEYDPNIFFMSQQAEIFFYHEREKCLSKLFNLVKNDPRFDYGLIYQENNWKDQRTIKLLIKENCTAKEYNAFCKDYDDKDDRNLQRRD
jgi:hypothetical protein